MFRWLLNTFLISIVCSAQPSLSNQTLPAFSSEEFIDVFFRELLDLTTTGYVLYGAKPLCIENYLDDNREIPGSKEHYFSIKMQLANKILPEILKTKKNKDYIFRLLKNEFLMINREKFIQTIKDNLLLFQHKFGVGITPEKILDSLLCEENDFRSLFQDSIALQGILLGYGTKNAMTYEKAMLLRKSLFSHETDSLPYKLPNYPTSKQELLKKMSQSPVWMQIKNEVQDLTHQEMSPNSRLKIPFSFHKDSTETKRLLDGYTKSQQTVESILKSKDCTKQVITRLGGTLTKLPKIPFTQEEVNRLSNIIARSIRNTFPEEFSQAFIEGMHAADECCSETTKHEKLLFFDVLRRNYSDHAATKALEMMVEKNNFSCLIPQRLYVQILKNSNSNQSFTFHYKTIKANFLFKDSDDKILGGTYQMAGPLEIQTSSLIPGLAHGILGMRMGEVREVILHPSLVYGTDSPIGKGTPIKINVELLELSDRSEDEDVALLTPIDVSHLSPNIASCSEYSSLQNDYFYFCGLRTWLHYKNAHPSITLDTILNECITAPSPLSNQEEMTLLKLEWMLYLKKMPSH